MCTLLVCDICVPVCSRVLVYVCVWVWAHMHYHSCMYRFYISYSSYLIGMPCGACSYTYTSVDSLVNTCSRYELCVWIFIYPSIIINCSISASAHKAKLESVLSALGFDNLLWFLVIDFIHNIYTFIKTLNTHKCI